ncbi:MAG: hypothetical protein QNK19_10950 [Xanthomonadales bacterium]|nr:hypothetical protein [Xanthomonadales bacterium]
MKVTNHLLSGDNIKIEHIPNMSGKFASGLQDTLVMHYTGGSSAESSVRHLCKEFA